MGLVKTFLGLSHSNHLQVPQVVSRPANNFDFSWSGFEVCLWDMLCHTHTEEVKGISHANVAFCCFISALHTSNDGVIIWKDQSASGYNKGNLNNLNLNICITLCLSGKKYIVICEKGLFDVIVEKKPCYKSKPLWVTLVWVCPKTLDALLTM